MIYVESKDLLDWFLDNSARLADEQVLIAESDNFEIYFDISDSNNPILRVYCGDEVEFVEECDYNELESEAQLLYDSYIVDPLNESDEVDDDGLSSEEEIEAYDDLIYERDDELNLAINEMLNVVLEGCKSDVKYPDGFNTSPKKELIANTKEHLLEYLAEFQRISVRHPMWVDTDEEADAGSVIQEYCEYPYDSLVQ